MPRSGSDERARAAVPWRSWSDLDMARTLSHFDGRGRPPGESHPCSSLRMHAAHKQATPCYVPRSAFEYVCLYFFPMPGLSFLLASLSLMVMEYVAVLACVLLMHACHPVVHVYACLLAL